MNAELREVLGLLEKASNGPLTAEDETHDIGRGMLRHYSVVRDADGENIVRLGYTDPNVHAFAAAVNFLSKHGPALLAAAQDGEDAARYRWLRPRLLCADFAYDAGGGEPDAVIVFAWRDDMSISADLDASIDSARSADAEGA